MALTWAKSIASLGLSTRALLTGGSCEVSQMGLYRSCSGTRQSLRIEALPCAFSVNVRRLTNLHIWPALDAEFRR